MRSPIYSYPLSAAGEAQWDAQGSLILPLDYIQLAFGVTCGGLLSSDAAGITYSFLFTLDDMGPDNRYIATVAQTGTTVTVTDTNLQRIGGVAAGDIARAFWANGLPSVWGVVATTPTPTSYTMTTAVAAPTPISARGGYHGYWRLFAAPASLTGLSARGSGSLAHSTTGPATGLVLRASAVGGGSVTGVVVQGAGPG
jgi:hypothetical protein